MVASATRPLHSGPCAEHPFQKRDDLVRSATVKDALNSRDIHAERLHNVGEFLLHYVVDFHKSELVKRLPA